MAMAVGITMGLLFSALLLCPTLLVVALRIWPYVEEGEQRCGCAKRSETPEAAVEPARTQRGGIWDGLDLTERPGRHDGY